MRRNNGYNDEMEQIIIKGTIQVLIMMIKLNL